MKAHVKKKNYRAHCRAQTLAGLINAPDGKWVLPVQTLISNHTEKCNLAGAMGKRFKLRG